MSAIAMGRQTEGIKVVSAFAAHRLEVAAATERINGWSATTGAIGIDTLGYEDITITATCGRLVGGDLTISLLESDTNDPTTASAITGAAFSAFTAPISTGAPASAVLGSIRAGMSGLTKRYLFVKAETSAAATADFSVIAILGRPKSQPVSQTYDFSL